MLLSLTPNPALDRTLTVPGFRAAEVTRIASTHDAAGGKGLNVARVAQALGAAVRVVAPLGGPTGQRVAALAAAENTDARWSWLETGETRTCQIVLDPAAPDTLVLNEHGPQITRADWQALAAIVRVEAQHAAALACSGSLPPGAAVEWLVELLNDVMAGDTPVWLDTSGAALQAALDLPLGLLKVNADELGAALDQPISIVQDAAAAAAAVRRRGPQAVIVTLGKAGAVAVDAGGAWHAQTPAVQAVSPTGSGDAVLAGVATALLAGRPLPEALRLGVACGAANTLLIGGGTLRLDDVRALENVALLEQIGEA